MLFDHRQQKGDCLALPPGIVQQPGVFELSALSPGLFLCGPLLGERLREELQRPFLVSSGERDLGQSHPDHAILRIELGYAG